MEVTSLLSFILDMVLSITFLDLIFVPVIVMGLLAFTFRLILRRYC